MIVYTECNLATLLGRRSHSREEEYDSSASQMIFDAVV